MAKTSLASVQMPMRHCFPGGRTGGRFILLELIFIINFMTFRIAENGKTLELMMMD